MDLLERLQGSIITPEDAAFWEIVGQLGPPARSEEAIGSLALPGLEEVATWVRCSNGSCACHETRFNPDGLIEIRDSKDLLSRAEPPVIAMTPEGYAEYFGRAAAPGDYDSFRVEDGNRFGQGMSLIAADVRLDFTPEETDAARFALAVKEPLVTIEGLNRTAEQDSGL